MHVDLDAFFAAVEQHDHPEWRGLPVIVGGDPTRRGVVSTASYEARIYGVHSAMSSARALRLCPDAVWAPSRFSRYREVSKQVFDIFNTESPRVQTVSIDEAFLDVTPGRGSAEHPITIAQRIRARVAELGVTASVGVATSKTVAKIASDRDKPDGLTVVWPGEEADFLSRLPVSAMSGIGPKSAQRLSDLGVRTLGDLAALDDTTAIALLGSHGPAMALRAAGVDTRPVQPNESAHQVSKERTFATDVRSAGRITVELDELSVEVARRLRRGQLAGRTVTVKMRFSDFTTRTAQRTLSEPTSDETVIGKVARELADGVWTPGVGLRLLGVSVSGFEASTPQLSIEDVSRPARGPELAKGLDAVREKYGEDALRFGSQMLRRRSDRQDETEDS